MIHQPLGGFRGQASDIEIHAREIIELKAKLNRLLAEHTGQPIEKLERDTDRDHFMSAEQARDYGLVDVVLDKRPKKKSIRGCYDNQRDTKLLILWQEKNRSSKAHRRQ